MARNEYFTRARRPFWHEMNTLQGRRGHSAIKCIFYEGAAAIIARNEYFAREIEVAACKALLYSFPGSWVPHVAVHFGVLQNDGTKCVVYTALSASLVILYWFLQ